MTALVLRTGRTHVGQTTRMVRYLSPAWVDELRAAVAGNRQAQAAAAGKALGITQAVSGGPDGDVVYHFVADADGISAGPGPARPEHVRFEEDWATASAIANGRVNAQEAFITGRIRFRGDHGGLIEARPVLVALDGALAELRARTEFT